MRVRGGHWTAPHPGADQLLVAASVGFDFCALVSCAFVVFAVVVARRDRGAGVRFFGSVAFAGVCVFLAVPRGVFAGALVAVACSDLGLSPLVGVFAAAGFFSASGARRGGFLGKARSGGRSPSNAGSSRVRMFRAAVAAGGLLVK